MGEIIRQAANEEERLHAADLERVEHMRAYAELLNCRREHLLSYGESAPRRCEFCDNCERSALPSVDQGAAAALEESGRPSLRKPVRREKAANEPDFPVHKRVFHPEWGRGVAPSIAGDGITILFDTAGEKTLSIRVVRERHLLERAS